MVILCNLTQLIPGLQANRWKSHKSTTTVEFGFSDPDQNTQKPVGKHATAIVSTMWAFLMHFDFLIFLVHHYVQISKDFVFFFIWPTPSYSVCLRAIAKNFFLTCRLILKLLVKNRISCFIDFKLVIFVFHFGLFKLIPCEG